MRRAATNPLTPSPKDLVLHVGPGRPLATLDAARDEIRRLPAEERARPIRVVVDAGTYFLTRPFVLGPRDSGTPEAPIVYQAAEGAAPLVSGGRPVSGWERTVHAGRPCWRTIVPDAATGGYFTQLFVNGARRPRAGLPKEGFFRFRDAVDRPGETRAGFFPGDLRRWRNLADVELTAYHYWVDSHLPVASVDEDASVVEFASPAVMSLRDENRAGFARYRAENVFEALERPGEWYLDRSDGTLRYLPLPGEDPETTPVVAPRLAHLLRLEGQTGAFVRDVHFAGLSFAHAEWRYPAGVRASIQAAVDVPGAILLTNARDCSFRLCRVSNVAGYAVELREGCEGTTIAASTFREMGGGGIKVGHGTRRTTVADNEIAEGGSLFPSAIGVWIGDSPDNAVVHNHIHHFFYTGVSLGWVWGFGPSRAHRNRIENNHIHHIGQGLLSDMGAIYSLGVSPGTRIRGNRIHDVRCYGYGGQGIYPDEGTSYVLIENNVATATDTGGLVMNYGRDNVVRNNILGLSRDRQFAWGSPKKYASFRFERNIVVWREGELLQGSWFDGLVQNVFRKNCYWKTSGAPADFGGVPWERWRTAGYDRGSVVADPLLADPEGGDFSLRADSPARRLGFKPVDASKAGPRRRARETGVSPVPPYPGGPIVWSHVETPETLAAGDRPEERFIRQGHIHPHPHDTPCSFAVTVCCENAGDRPFSGPVTVAARTGRGKTLLRRRIDVRDLAPGGRFAVEQEIAVPAGTREVLVGTASPAPGFWPTSLSFLFRETVEVPVIPADTAVGALAGRLKGAAPMRAAMGDLVLGEARMACAGDALALLFTVNDDRIEVLDPVYKGSMIDLFAMADPSTGTFAQLFLPPGAGDRPARLLTVSMEPVAGSDLAFARTASGYEVSILVPRAALGIPAGAAEFGFTAGVYTHLPGVAGILRASLFGSAGRHDPAAYGRIRPKRL